MRRCPQTDPSFDTLEGPFARGDFLGDCIGLAADATDVLAVFTQAGTDEGDSDIFFRRSAHLGFDRAAAPRPGANRLAQRSER